jgi:hypothetical protein
MAGVQHPHLALGRDDGDALADELSAPTEL